MVKLITGRHSSAMKELRKSSRRRKVNLLLKNKIRTSTHKFKVATNKKDIDTAKTLLNELFSHYDKAVKQKVIFMNTAGRKKSKLTKLLYKISKASDTK